MTLLDLIARVRQRLDDQGGDTGTAPATYTYYWEYDDAGTLWKNAELVAYANAACMELAHRVPIRDSGDNETTRIALRSGTARYEIDPRILEITRVVLASTETPLIKIANAQERSQWNDPYAQTYADPSTVAQYTDDLDALTLTVFATPTTSDTLWLAVKRLPLEPLTWSGRKSEEPEFASHHQEALIEWVCSLALMKRDSDTQDKEAAGYHQGRFTDMVGPRVDFRQAKVLKDVAGVRLRTRAYY
jgi:hypothetical protein